MHTRRDLDTDLADIESQIDRMTFDAWRREGAAGAGAADTDIAATTSRPAPPEPVEVDRILVATDGSDHSHTAVAWAAALAPFFDARVTVLTVVPPRWVLDSYNAAGVALYATEHVAGEEVLERAATRLRDGGIPADAVLSDGDPAQEILHTAEQEEADLVVLGSHGYGVAGRLVLGSVADAVRRHTNAHVLVAKQPPPPDRFVLPVDGSQTSKRAASLGLRMREWWGGEALLLHAMDVPIFGAPERTASLFRDAIEGIEAASPSPQVHVEVEFGHPAERIAQAASGKAPTLVVMGSRGLSGLQGALMGSVSNRVVHESEASVLVVRPAPAR